MPRRFAADGESLWQRRAGVAGRTAAVGHSER
jgi:hypothetical protein